MNKGVHTVTKVQLSPSQNNGRGGIEGTDMWDPIGGDVVEGHWVDNAEAEDEDIHLGIPQGAKMIKLFLSKTEL